MQAIVSYRITRTKRLALCALTIGIVLVLSLIYALHAFAASSTPDTTGKRLVTVHDRGNELGLVTSASTLREVFKENDISIADNDLVEPGLDEKLVANSYQVNVYRARPVLVVDGAVARKVLSPYQTARQIARDADIELHDEDVTNVGPIADVAVHGPGIQVTIDRATPFTLVLYGKKTQAYTQEATVADMLASKDITLEAGDTISVDRDGDISPGMTIEIWRNGKQTVTVNEDVAFSVKQIQDADQKVGYRNVKTPGVKGEASVTYEIVMKNGKEVSRKKIQSVVTKESRQQVEIVGSKPAFDGDFGAALAKLRQCEAGGNYANKSNPLYRGAYQFGFTTWANRYGIRDPADATPAQQDQAARDLYVSRGWQPWPHCGASLPDIYR